MARAHTLPPPDLEPENDLVVPSEAFDAPRLLGVRRHLDGRHGGAQLDLTQLDGVRPGGDDHRHRAGRERRRVPDLPDLSAVEGAGEGSALPAVSVSCSDTELLVTSNGMPGYTFEPMTPNALEEQEWSWSVPLDPQLADTTTTLTGVLGTIGFTVTGLPIYGPMEGPMPEQEAFGDPVHNGVGDSCQGHTGPRPSTTCTPSRPPSATVASARTARTATTAPTRSRTPSAATPAPPSNSRVRPASPCPPWADPVIVAGPTTGVAEITSAIRSRPRPGSPLQPSVRREDEPSIPSGAAGRVDRPAAHGRDFEQDETGGSRVLSGVRRRASGSRRARPSPRRTGAPPRRAASGRCPR